MSFDRDGKTAELPDARPIVDDLLRQAIGRGASDIHVEPTAEGCEVRLRVDGLLETVARYEMSVGRAIISRLMVLAQLLTYRQDIPQEGRFAINLATINRPVDLRLAIMPTTHGLRAAVRLPADFLQPVMLDELGLPGRVVADLKDFAGLPHRLRCKRSRRCARRTPRPMRPRGSITR